MAINKQKNVILQITISKSDAEKLQNVQDTLSTLLGVELTKSQAIAFLIKNYGKSPLNKGVDAQERKVQTLGNKTILKGVNYQAQIIALKDKLGASYPRLSQIIGISQTSLKRYANGQQAPSGDNAILLNEALAKYGIK